MRDLSMDDGSFETPTQGHRSMAILVCVFASLGGIFFGYDQGVTGGVLIMDSFLNDFCVTMHDGTPPIPSNHSAFHPCKLPANELPSQWVDFTMMYNTVYNVGCVLGALLGGLIADKFGRRGTIFIAALLFCVGTIGVCAVPRGYSHWPLFVVARLIQGMGTGNSSFSMPIFGAEVSPKELRGFLSGFMQMMIVTGILIANCMNLIMRRWDNGWRYANAVAIVPALIVMIGIWCVPESPRWVYLHKGADTAEHVLKRLRQSDDVCREMDAIGEQIARDGGRESEWKDLKQPSLLTRVVTAMMVQVLQQATGINPVFTYGGLIFYGMFGTVDKAEGTLLAVSFLSLIFFISTIFAMRWVDTTGRRQLLLIGAIGMFIGHLASGVTFETGCNSDNSSLCTRAAAYIVLASTGFFVFNFAISWGPVCWIYPAEIFPLSVRAKAVSLSTMANWIMGAVMTVSVQSVKVLNNGGIFFAFAVLCAGCGTFVYYKCPETKGILLEDVEELFHRETYDSKYFTNDSPMETSNYA